MLTPSTKFTDVLPEDYMTLGTVFTRGDANRVMSRSELKRFDWCPSRWLAGEQDEESDALQWGSLVDCIALTPDQFQHRYAVASATYSTAPEKPLLTDAFDGEWNPRTKVCREWKAARESEGSTVLTPEQFAKATEPKEWNWNADVCAQWREGQKESGKIVIKASQELAARGAVARLMDNPKIARVLDGSRRQVPLVVDYRDEDTGLVIPLKVLIDVVPTGDCARYLVDLKTTGNAHPSMWAREVFKHWYDAQAALYLDAWNACNDDRRDTFLHIKQENYPPYETGTQPLSEDFIVSGRARYIAALRKYCQCLATDVWPDFDTPGLGQWCFGGFGPVCEPESFMVLAQL